MADDDQTDQQDTDQTDGQDVDTQGADDQQTDDQDGADQLGDAGKKALDSMKAQNKRLREQLAEVRAGKGDPRGVESIRQKAQVELREQIAELTAKLEGREAEYQSEKAAREAGSAAVAQANARILRSEVKAAAAGKLADPADAHRFLDLSKFEVDDDGNVDQDELADAIDDLLSKKPYLAAAAAQGGGRRFQGDGAGGARKEKPKTLQDQIADAEKAGDSATVFRLKSRQAIASNQ